ncbi:MAG TPA: hypothetical protein VK762_06155, partial [Polyangiaceae bacterium]|nr:hypothetical protein [Polyangiaceae bacterium]
MLRFPTERGLKGEREVMGKKGRRGRARKGQARSASAAPAPLDDGPATLRSAGLVTSAPPAAAEAPALALVSAPATGVPEREGECAGASSPPEPQQAPDAAEASAPEPAPGAAETPPLLSPEPQRAPSGEDSEGEPAPPEAAEESVPPAGDLDARFFEESPSEAWLAHELELRDPRFVRKMTANVAQRRAHLARYVVGVVGVAVALCLAALIKSAVPAGDDESRAHPATPMA